MMKMDGSPSVRTMVIVAHMDDEVLGAGGLIRKRVCCGEQVFVLSLFGRKYAGVEGMEQTEEDQAQQRRCMEAAKNVLGYQQWDCLSLEEGEPGKVGYYDLLLPIEHYLKAWHPTEVVIPGRSDLSQDHRHLNEVCRIALRAGNRCQDPQQGPIKRCMEMIGHDLIEQPQADYAVVLNDKLVGTVLDAWKCYEREQREFPHVRSMQNVVTRYRHWGGQFGFALAEPFRLLFETE
jgi:N-acetylglucosamine malate deacetylase 1